MTSTDSKPVDDKRKAGIFNTTPGSSGWRKKPDALVIEGTAALQNPTGGGSEGYRQTEDGPPASFFDSPAPVRTPGKTHLLLSCLSPQCKLPSQAFQLELGT